jgi:hypothetical protein
VTRTLYNEVDFHSPDSLAEFTRMSTQPEPIVSGENSLDSFVLRFVHGADDASRPTAAWHGVIRHVQSNRERAFNRWGDAVSFINEFVDIVADESAA